MLFYIYNHDVTLTLYINWTVFLHKSCNPWSAHGSMYGQFHQEDSSNLYGRKTTSLPRARFRGSCHVRMLEWEGTYRRSLQGKHSCQDESSSRHNSGVSSPVDRPPSALSAYEQPQTHLSVIATATVISVIPILYLIERKNYNSVCFFSILSSCYLIRQYLTISTGKTAKREITEKSC